MDPTELPTLKIEELRQAALARLRTAVAAANAPDAPPSALKRLYIPQHRFEKLRPEKAPFVHVAAKSDGGQGESHQVPQFDLIGVLHINLFHAGTRGEAPDLDGEVAEMAQAIALVLLEDTTFLEQFAWVSALRFTIDDGVAKGDQGSEYDCVLVQIELELAEGQERFEPKPGVPLQVIRAKAELGDPAESIPGQSLDVEQEILFPEPFVDEAARRSMDFLLAQQRARALWTSSTVTPDDDTVDRHSVGTWTGTWTDPVYIHAALPYTPILLRGPLFFPIVPGVTVDFTGIVDVPFYSMDGYAGRRDIDNPDPPPDFIDDPTTQYADGGVNWGRYFVVGSADGVTQFVAPTMPNAS
jgi:hypothetical protein